MTNNVAAEKHARTTGYLAHAITHTKNSLQYELRALKSEIAKIEKALGDDRLLYETASGGAGHLARYAATADKHAHAYNTLLRAGYVAVDTDTVMTPNEVVKALLKG